MADKCIAEAWALINKLEDRNEKDKNATLDKLEQLAKKCRCDPIKDLIAYNVYRIAGIIIYPFILTGLIDFEPVRQTLEEIGLIFLNACTDFPIIGPI